MVVVDVDGHVARRTYMGLGCNRGPCQVSLSSDASPEHVPEIQITHATQARIQARIQTHTSVHNNIGF